MYIFFHPNYDATFLTNYDILDDILNVRLQTLGVMEHSFPVNMAGRSYNWKLYDVGGAVSDALYIYIYLISLFKRGQV